MKASPAICDILHLALLSVRAQAGARKSIPAQEQAVLNVPMLALDVSLKQRCNHGFRSTTRITFSCVFLISIYFHHLYAFIIIQAFFTVVGHYPPLKSRAAPLILVLRRPPCLTDSPSMSTLSWPLDINGWR